MVLGASANIFQAAGLLIRCNRGDARTFESCPSRRSVRRVSVQSIFADERNRGNSKCAAKASFRKPTSRDLAAPKTKDYGIPPIAIQCPDGYDSGSRTLPKLPATLRPRSCALQRKKSVDTHDRKLNSARDGEGRLRGASELEAQVEKRFGVLPNFFRLTPENPEITAKLWGFARFCVSR